MTEDRPEKGALYAKNGIPECWIVDTARERVEGHSEMVGGAHSRVTPYRRGEVITSVGLPDFQVRVDDIFG